MIELHGDDGTAFEILLQYIYHGKYSFSTLYDTITDSMERLVLLFEISAVADKYRVLRLDELACDHIGNMMLSQQHDPDFKLLQIAIQLHYTSNSMYQTERGKDIMREALRPGKALVKSALFDEMITSQPLFAVDLALACKAEGSIRTFMRQCYECPGAYYAARDKQNGMERNYFCSECGKGYHVQRG